ncbi:hypothetical protein PE36_00310 [Moritella sp. PE36]|uniref:hypothetical protein n=1 Tax=Moritella sp. PE36 TaxID=58051 RepID=UPI00015693DA|nr:hypothetical protein [Moritella sp. PE36]EDM66193.1 hypothetical protein PE36_00310 [Moritella sp. PE36]
MSFVLLLDLDLRKTDSGGNPIGFVYQITTAAFNVIYEGNEYMAVGDLLEIDDLSESADLSSIGTTITLSGINPSFRREIDNGSFLKSPIDLRIGEITPGTNIIPDGTAGYVHRGFCDTPNSEIDHSNGSLTIAVATESVFQSLTKTPDLCRTSQSSHEARHNGDKFFTYVASTAQEETWKT